MLELLDTRHTWAELGKPPNFDTCTRDTYPPETSFSPARALRTLRGVAAACAHLHSRGFTHGDLYAHNTLVDTSCGEAKVGDFGAAYLYKPLGPTAAPAIERIEARAFGCLAEEMLERLGPKGDEAGRLAAALQPLVGRCMQPEVLARPSFAEIVAELAKAKA